MEDINILKNIQTRQELLNAIAAGAKPTYCCFWGHTPPKNGGVSNSCLSQWYPCSFQMENIIYQTAEHWMMAEKARLFGDSGTLEKILIAETPNAAKALGREVANFDAGKWAAARFDIVVAGNRAKFSQSGALKDFLLGIKEDIIVEASPFDRIWGIGLGKDTPNAQIPKDWRGENLLGFALMMVREQLRDLQFNKHPGSQAIHPSAG
jgi:ribA/ribD-fused uncharacterized protein